MNILYLAHRIPYPPDKGDKLRSYRELEHLARRHRVWCACFVDDPSDERHVKPLSALCHDVAAVRLSRTWAKLRGLTGLLSGRTITEAFYAHPRMHATLSRWSSTVAYDAVVAFSSSMAPYALEVRAKRRILDLCDLDSQKWLDFATASRGPARWLYATEGTRLKTAERNYIRAFDATLLITHAEAEPLSDVEKRGRLHIVGNGVSLPELDDHPSGDRVSTKPEERTDAPVVGFVGVMDYRPNVEAVCWFVSNCWARIRRAFPTASFRIVGRSPSRRVRKLSRIPGVEVVGRVDDALTEVMGFDVSVAPMRTARGLQNKVLEAMAAARPVVLTTLAAEGIDARNGHEFLITDGSKTFADRVVRLLSDPTERGRIGRNARRFVPVIHCWEEHMSRFELIVAGAIVRSARREEVRPEAKPIPTEELVDLPA